MDLHLCLEHLTEWICIRAAYFRPGRRQAVSTILGWPASPSLPGQKTLTLGATPILLGALSFDENGGVVGASFSTSVLITK